MIIIFRGLTQKLNAYVEKFIDYTGGYVTKGYVDDDYVIY